MHGLHGFSQLGGLAGRFFQIFFNRVGGLVALFTDFFLDSGGGVLFLDVGGGATTERVTEAFKLITAGEGVKAILVNIFGGIVRCDLIAEGIITAAKDVGINVPVVVRLEGTNAEEGRKLLEESDFDLIAAQDLTDAAKKVVAEAKG